MGLVVHISIMESFNQELYSYDIALQINQLVKHLGLELDMKINWKHCIRNISKRFSSVCFQMFVMRDTVDLKWYYDLLFIF